MPKHTKDKKQNLIESLQNVNNIAYMAQLDSKRWLMEFVEGDFKDDEAWFLKTPDGSEFITLPQQALHNLIQHMQKGHEEKLCILLRYEIRNLMPIDLEDTMVVALYELEKYRQSDGNLPHSLDIQGLAQKIKTTYPNLFLQLDRFLQL